MGWLQFVNSSLVAAISFGSRFMGEELFRRSLSDVAGGVVMAEADLLDLDTSKWK